MIRRKIFTVLIIIAVLTSVSNWRVFAMNTGFTTDSMEAEDQQKFLSNIGLHLITEEPSRSTIQCFDINENGLIAIGTEDYSNKTVAVYDTSGHFQYGYRFTANGDFGIEWDEHSHMMIYFVRSNVAALFDEKGNHIELRKIQITTDNTSYWNNSVNTTQRTVGECRYTIENSTGVLPILADSSSQLVKIAADGNTTVLYNADKSVDTVAIIKTIAETVFIVAVVFAVVLMLRKNTYRSH